MNKLKRNSTQKQNDANLLQAGSAHFKPPPDPTDKQELMLRIQAGIKAIRNDGRMFVDAYKAGGKDTTTPEFRKLLTEDLNTKFYDLSTTMNHEELIECMVSSWTVLVMRELI